MDVVAVHGRIYNKDSEVVLYDLISLLSEKKSEIVVSKSLHKAHPSLAKYDFYDPVDNLSADCLISIGGDGTFLESVTHINRSEIPILGINLGRLGFLASIDQTQIERAVDVLHSGQIEYDQRALISLESSIDLFGGHNYALNEFAIHRKDSSSMIVINCYLDGEFLNSYWADGLMVSTSTGSTGYSLSCGGPLVMPGTNNFLVTPVSPHNLNVRPLVVSNESVIEFKIETRDKRFMVSLDSRSVTIDSEVKLKVKKADFHVSMIKVPENTYFQTLRSKLSWGLDKRN